MKKKIENKLKELKEKYEILKNKKRMEGNRRMTEDEAEVWWLERDGCASKIEILEELLTD